ncbi:hypothetical protein QQS21_000290 [Conoideocrella luteorostrata]|uniref:F-box domain-containing protein n=1 Tax=Conoideocrella luteorostrata TaxID=1105319 RepID=A0AAJ0G2R1_9HYPO|nr:hypothetical protein QQS21_000290 [Conoideocrella luteorostrata]
MASKAKSPSATSRPWVQLPEDIFSHIFSFVFQPDLLNCRLLNHDLGSLATTWAFRHIRLEANLDDENDRFVQLAMSPKLRLLVREITCDTWIGPNYRYHTNGNYLFPVRFMKDLPCLRFFASLKTLHLRFSQYCGSRNNEFSMIEIEESYDFRYRVLDTVFQCLAGTWSAEGQRKLDDSLDLSLNIKPDSYKIPSGHVTTSPIHIKTFTVSNLADYDDKRLTSSDAFQKVINSRHLTDLKLLIAVAKNVLAPEITPYYREKYEMFQSLPQTWLSPVLAQNLKVLSLFCNECWGWSPKMDFRAVNPTAGSESGFPALRVLALGNYIFSHVWQIDWIATLGRKNGRGGLEELYLDDCPILFHARYYTRLDNSTTTYGQDANGVDIVVSNKGYPTIDNMTDRTLAQNRQDVASYDLRWHHILPQWRQKMTALKVFKMGHGNWDGPPLETQDALWCAYGADHKSEVLDHRISNNNFLSYDCPAPRDDDVDNTTLDIAFLHGTGISQRVDYLLPYVEYDKIGSPSSWLERLEEEWSNCSEEGKSELEEGARAPGEETRMLDEAALKALQEAIAMRIKSGGGT